MLYEGLSGSVVLDCVGEVSVVALAKASQADQSQLKIKAVCSTK